MLSKFEHISKAKNWTPKINFLGDRTNLSYVKSMPRQNMSSLRPKIKNFVNFWFILDIFRPRTKKVSEKLKKKCQVMRLTYFVQYSKFRLYRTKFIPDTGYTGHTKIIILTVNHNVTTIIWVNFVVFRQNLINF